METSLHRSLKECYGPARGGQVEVTVAGYRIDAVGPDGELIEVQSGALGPLREKAGALLTAGYRLRVVKPLPIRRRIVRQVKGKVDTTRWSPWRGSVVDVFEDLVGLSGVLARPGLSLDVLEVEVDEVRVRSRRRDRVIDRRLIAVRAIHHVSAPGELWRLLPAGVPDEFTTLDLVSATGRPVWIAQRVAYCLRQSGAASATGKVGNRVIYAKAGTEARSAATAIV